MPFGLLAYLSHKSDKGICKIRFVSTGENLVWYARTQFLAPSSQVEFLSGMQEIAKIRPTLKICLFAEDKKILPPVQEKDYFKAVNK